MKKNSLVEGTIISYIMILMTKLMGAIYVIPFYRIIGESGGVLYSYAYNIYNLFYTHMTRLHPKMGRNTLMPNTPLIFPIYTNICISTQ